MEHKEYKRIYEDSDTVILFIHGIVGTPDHFDEFIKLIPDNVSVYNMLLDGHGKTVRDFSKTSMKKWEEQVDRVVSELSLTHNKIYIVAHSLGSLLAIEQSLKSKSINRLFLLAVPLKLSLKLKMINNILHVYLGKIAPDDYWTLAAKKCYGIAEEKNPFHYIGWIPRFLELFSKMRHTRKMIQQIKIPCQAYQSGMDEMVSGGTLKYLKDNPNISVNMLKNSGHYYYDKRDWNFLLEEFQNMIAGKNNGYNED